jgi:hypothetical protein
MNTQRVTPCPAVPAQADGEDLRAMLDGKRVWFGGAAVEKCAEGHVSSPGRQEIDRILP